MHRIFFFLAFIWMLSIATTSFAVGVELAGGAWYQSPDGTLSFDKTTRADDLDLRDDLNYDDKWQPLGRLKVDMPLLIPNIYLMYTPMKWDEEGNKNVRFNFGDKTFEADVDFDSELKMSHLDAALYYGLPFVTTATADVLNVDLGLNVRLMDFKAEIQQQDTGLKDSVSYLLPLPMIYSGMQIQPVKLIAFEFEGRGIAYSSNHYVSLIGRLKVKPFGPVFAAAGYRFDAVKIDYQDVDVDAEFSGPFAEIGFEF